jgi:hypothetical protein
LINGTRQTVTLPDVSSRITERQAFPSALAQDVEAVALRLSVDETPSSMPSFGVLVQSERIEIPGRLYHHPRHFPNERQASTQPERIAACLGTRHHDGFVRERCLRNLLPVTEPWAVPYVVALLGEYVLPIIEIIEAHFQIADLEPYVDFLAGNMPYFQTTERRVMSYWDAYYRHAFPQRETYPGFRVVTILKDALAKQESRTLTARTCPTR